MKTLQVALYGNPEKFPLITFNDFNRYYYNDDKNTLIVVNAEDEVVGEIPRDNILYMLVNRTDGNAQG